ncbi:hypothetical protein LSH36_473g03027 [Paralvinella palmiformis]|uniref:Uncharacterized protein n=1 Tax=Paralvinella palmiformis TaxID=53620 RepID=A0AAD9J9I3_9ANNE|nr:hypothetical protein LSH36_473g03027 [Paralvinella palmiformis]
MQKYFCLAHVPNMMKLLKPIMSLYQGRKHHDLDKRRCQRFKEKVVRCSKQIQAQVLPPTSGAAEYQSLRTFHRMREWKGESLNANEYGWKEKHSRLIPLRTDLPPAPES